MGNEKKGQMNLDLVIPEKIKKKMKGYYLSVDLIKFVKDEAKELDTSENVLLAAIIEFYQRREQRN